jgi:tetratricopeptide (TPR) repeat protein
MQASARRHGKAARRPGRAAAARAAPAPARAPWRRLAILAAALGPLLVYWPATGYGFMLDDFVLFQTSPSLSDLGSIPKGFLTDLGALRKGGETVISSYYRPVFLALSTLYHQLAGGSPFAWHLAAVGLASLIGALACGLLMRLGLPPPLALLASIVFSLHPSHVSSVAWASGLQELLAACFVLCALLAMTWRRQSGGSGGDGLPLVLACVSYALALLSKEVAIGLLPFAAVWALGASRTDADDGRAEARRRWRLAGALAAVTAVYLGVRVAVLGGLVHPLAGAPSLRASLAAVPVAVVTYLRLLVWPLGFSIFRPERPVFAPFAPQVLISAAILLGLGLLAAWAIGKRRELALPLAWLIVWLLPVLNLWALDPQWMVTDRYLFLPSLALPWIAALLLPRRPAIWLLSLLAVVFAVLAFRYSAIFHDQRTFLAAMERAEPTSPLVFAEKGRLLLQDGDLPAARAALERAVALDPLAPGALIALGSLELRQGELDAAEQHYRRSLVVRPHASRGFKLLAIALSRAGRQVRAFSLIEEASRRWPDDFQVQLLHAVFLGAAGQRRQAEAAFAAARRLRPRDPAVAGSLDDALARLLPTIEAQPAAPGAAAAPEPEPP